MNDAALKRYRKAINELLRKRKRAGTKQPPRCWEEDFQPVPAGGPTQARPGTYEKLEVMRARWALGQQLYHPKDAW